MLRNTKDQLNQLLHTISKLVEEKEEEKTSTNKILGSLENSRDQKPLLRYESLHSVLFM